MGSWYNLFSNIYDTALEKLYHESRVRAVELLELKKGDKVLDVACGTGANFKHIKALHIDVEIYGTDYSEGMLKRAEAHIAKNNWQNITLFQSDARHLNRKLIQEQVGQNLFFDKIICALGLSVIPDWENVLEQLLSLLKPSGQIVIIDVFAEKRTFHTWLVEKIAQADLDRQIWQTLAQKTTNFYHEYQTIKERKVGGKLFVAKGTKSKALDGDW